ncbi:MAG: DNA-protecting protein DprA [Clostridiaceae bacterium]|jgi:DNA processing protein|nr:DNA-protecting protein DprA [Clostridiaceae bacterium]
MNPKLREWIWFANLKGIITRKKNELLELFGTPDSIYEADAVALAKTGILSRENIDAILSVEARKTVDETMEKIALNNIDVITLEDNTYPELLKNIADPPVCLYVRGDIRRDEISIGVVGSRRASGYGLSTTRKISSELAEYGICVISGMARGIDTAAHQGALSSGGRTVAVFGCGLDVVYPPENRRLMERIIGNGAVVSEYPPGTIPAPHHFPVRNRIVSGMSIGVLVVEAGEKSGSLITAQLALEQGRDVYALPGNVISINSRGTNKLIQDGAKLVTSVDDIIDEIRWYKNFKKNIVINLNDYKNRKKIPDSLDAEEQSVIEMLSVEPLQIDEIHSRLSIEIQILHRVLLSLEMKGLIRREPGGKYVVQI